MSEETRKRIVKAKKRVRCCGRCQLCCSYMAAIGSVISILMTVYVIFSLDYYSDIFFRDGTGEIRDY